MKIKKKYYDIDKMKPNKATIRAFKEAAEAKIDPNYPSYKSTDEFKAAIDKEMKRMDEMYEKAITITEFRRHFSYYINKSQTEDVYITIRGRLVSKLSNPNK